MSFGPPSQTTSFNPYAVGSVLPAAGPSAGNAGSIFQSGKWLVVHKTAQLPGRCIKSNEPTDSRLKRKLYWHHPAVYLAILFNLIVYAVIALAIRKSAQFDIPLAPRYKQRRIRNILIAWAMVFAGIGIFILAAVMARPNSPSALLFLLVPIFIIGGALVGIFGCRVVYAKKIDDHYVWLGGTCDAFRAQFPVWPYPY